MKYLRESAFREMIDAFVAQKHALGYPYQDSERILNVFDKFCHKHYRQKKVLTRDIGLHWAIRWNSEGRGGHRNRVMVIREFAKFLKSIGQEAFIIPIELTRKPARIVPHIYTQDELHAFFKVIDSLKYCSSSPARHLGCPVYFRLLYCCGLRPAEARQLLVKNFDLDKGIITIIESKGHKDRIVVLQPDVLALCVKYHALVSKIFPVRKYFFPNQNGTGYYSKEGMQKTFRKCIRQATLKSFNGNQPRIYDFRHSFATRRMNLWLQEGKDINAYFPFLSVCMGHVQISDTAYYIHLVPEFFSYVKDFDVSKYENALPEDDAK